jgi:hypothetical protein
MLFSILVAFDARFVDAHRDGTHPGAADRRATTWGASSSGLAAGHASAPVGTDPQPLHIAGPSINTTWPRVLVRRGGAPDRCSRL